MYAIMILCCFDGDSSSLLHYMLPRKRPVEAAVVDGDNVNAGSESDTLLKKTCLISCTNTTTTKSGDGGMENGRSSNKGGGSSVHKPSVTMDDGNQQDIDEDLHSRQLAVYGRETMRRLFASNVLVSGMHGLGAEIGMHFIQELLNSIHISLH